MKLYRSHPSGKFGGENEFWSSNPNYPRYIHGDEAPFAVATLSEEARVARFYEGSPSLREISRLCGEVDVAVWPIWDFEGDEYVVLNPHVLSDIRFD